MRNGLNEILWCFCTNVIGLKFQLCSSQIKRVKNAIRKSFFEIVRRCEVPLKAQKDGKKFRTTYMQLERAKGLGDVIKRFKDFLNEKFDQKRCRARQAKLSGKVTRFLRWAQTQTTAPK